MAYIYDKANVCLFDNVCILTSKLQERSETKQRAMTNYIKHGDSMLLEVTAIYLQVHMA